MTTQVDRLCDDIAIALQLIKGKYHLTPEEMDEAINQINDSVYCAIHDMDIVPTPHIVPSE